MTPIPRVVEENEENELLKMAMMILSLPRPETKAIVVFPGMGEIWRLEHAIQVFSNPVDFGSDYLLIAGCDWKNEKTQPQPTIELVKKSPFILPDCDLKFVHIQEHARHTPDQTGWVVVKIRELEIKSVSLVVSPYHLVRAYLTLLKECIKCDIRIPIIPIPVPISPSTIIPESGADSWTMVDGEAERIKKYQGDNFKNVATFEELKNYLDWLWKQPLLNS